MAKPWLEAGYNCLLVDPQHLTHSKSGKLEKFAGTIIEASARISTILANEKVVFVAGFPPCTDLAVSGARWFESKRRHDKHFQAKAALVAEQCRMIGVLAGCPWMFENPVSVLSGIFGKPDHIFHPHWFTAYEENDNYTKATCLWVGGGFVMPRRNKNDQLGEPDNRIHRAPPSYDRANFRSATPMGFARAVFLENNPRRLSEQQAAA